MNSLCLCIKFNCSSVYLCIRRTLVDCRLLSRSVRVLSSSLKVISSTDGRSNVSFDWESSCSSSAARVSSYNEVVIVGDVVRWSFWLISLIRFDGAGRGWGVAEK